MIAGIFFSKMRSCGPYANACASRAHYFTELVQSGLYPIVSIFLRPATPPTIYAAFIPPNWAYEASLIFGPETLKLTRALSMIP